MQRFIRKFILLLVLMTLPVAAWGQVWLPDRSNREGPGIMLGDSLVFHPGLGVEGGYDTNTLRRAEAVEGAGRLRITPYLDLATRSKKRRVQDEEVIEATPPKVNFRLGVAGYYDVFFSKEKAVDDQDHIGIDTHLNFILFPEGMFSLLADASYMRTLQPYESSQEHWAWHRVTPGIGFRIKPGGGTLSFESGYRLTLMFFEDDFLADRNDRMTHDVRFVTSWKILPKTALISKINFSPNIYVASGDINNDSMPVRSLFGLQGLFTDKFGMSLFVGYGASFYSSGDDFDSVIASCEFMFFITPTANIRLGGQRDFVDSFYSNYFEKNGGYLKYEQMFGGIVLASLKGDVFHRGYSRLTGSAFNNTTQSQDERNDIWIGATLLVEVRATDWLSFHASGRYQGNITDFEYETTFTDDTTGASTVTTNAVEFQKFEVLAGVRAHY